VNEPETVGQLLAWMSGPAAPSRMEPLAEQVRSVLLGLQDRVRQSAGEPSPAWEAALAKEFRTL
jgi:hypothetical protein